MLNENNLYLDINDNHINYCGIAKVIIRIVLYNYAMIKIENKPLKYYEKRRQFKNNKVGDSQGSLLLKI